MLSNAQNTRRRLVVASVCLSSIGLLVYRTIQKATSYTNSADVFSIASRKGSLPIKIASLLNNTYSIGNKKLYFHYDKFQTNHQLPAAVALLHLGASCSNVTAFIHGIANEMLDSPQEYQRRNPDKDVLGEYKCTWNDIGGYSGKEYNYYGIRNMFIDDLQNKYNGDIHKLVADRYPLISHGLIGGALHGVIHIGYGLAVSNDEAIIDGLTFSIFISNSLNQHNSASNNIDNTWNNKGTLGFVEVLDAIRGDIAIFRKVFLEHKNEFNFSISLQNRVEILKQYLSKHMMQYLIMMEKPKLTTKEDLDTVSAWLMSSAIKLYTYSSNENDFFLLHGVTASWAIVHVLRCLNNIEDVKSVLDDFLLAIVYLYVVLGVPEIIESVHKSDDIKASITEVIHDEILPNYQTGRNVCKNHEFVYQEHQVKVCQVLMDCLERNIIDEQTAFDGVVNATKKFCFDSGKIWD